MTWIIPSQPPYVSRPCDHNIWPPESTVASQSDSRKSNHRNNSLDFSVGAITGMVNLADLPYEILSNIVSYLNILDTKGISLIRYIQPQHGPAHIGITLHKSSPDASLFDTIRVCRSWRNLVFQQISKEDVSKGLWNDGSRRLIGLEVLRGFLWLTW